MEAIVTGIVSNILKAIHIFGKDSSLFIKFSTLIGELSFICKTSFKICSSETKSKPSILE